MTSFSQVKPTAIRLKALPQIPARLLEGVGIDIAKANGDTTISMDFSQLRRDDAPSNFNALYAVTSDPAGIPVLVPAPTLKGQKGDPGAQGPAGSPGDQGNFTSVSAASGTSISALTSFVRTAGYNTVGDGGGALYKRVASQPTHGGRFRSTDRYLPNGTTDNTNGGWWEIAEGRVSVKMFGALGDGTTDDTSAFQSMIGYMAAGGQMFIPKGTYRVTSSLNMVSGQRWHGDGQTNNVFGTSNPVAKPSHIFLDSNTGSLFTHTNGLQMESVRFEDLSFGTRATPNTTPRGSTIGFTLSGVYPNDIKHMSWIRCQFTNFGGYAIFANDPSAPGANPDWNVCPVDINDCSFFFNTIGIYWGSENCDYWTIKTTNFVGENNFGVMIQRGGVLTMIDCCGGGTGSHFLVLGTGANHIRDTIDLINCQYEGAASMVWVQIASLQPLYRPINLIGCSIEADIKIDANCHIAFNGCRWVNNMNVTASGALIDSLNDSFLSGVSTWNIAAGSEVRNFMTNGQPLPAGVRGYILDGRYMGKGTAPPTGGTFKVGDIHFNSAASLGQPAGWMCTTAGTPGTWSYFGQTGYRSFSGSPNNVAIGYPGELGFDSTNANFYMNVNGGGSWKIIT